MAPTMVPPGTAPRTPVVVWAGLAVVLTAAAVLSFDELRQLALAVSISDRLAWLLPIVVDAGAAVSCATWLGNRTAAGAARFAGRMTWALLTVTVAGNAGQLGMHANHIAAPWWVAVLVGMIPPAVVGSVVHLVVLLVRTNSAVGAAVDEHQPVTSLALEVVQSVVDQDHDTVPAEDPLVTKARELVAKGAGRPTLVKELSITDYKAGKLIESIRADKETVA